MQLKKSSKCKICGRNVLNKKSKDNNYCAPHEIVYLNEKYKKEGKKLCSKSKRGCRNIIDFDSKLLSCVTCRTKELNYERIRSNNCLKIILNKQLNKQINDKLCQADEEIKICNNPIIENTKYCHHHRGYIYRDELIKQNIVTKRCLRGSHFDREDVFKKNDKPIKLCPKCIDTRDKCEIRRCSKGKRIRDYMEYEKRPESKLVRQKWKKEHPEKSNEYCNKYRTKKRLFDSKSWLEHNTLLAKIWRDTNPEAVKKIRNKAKLKPINIMKDYKLCASNRNISFELTLEEFTNIISHNCHYCDYKDDIYFNGVDRKNNKLGYTIDNCLPCCRICNFMKCDNDYDDFIGMIGHIGNYLMFFNDIETHYYPHLFENCISGNYNTYTYNAKRRNIIFDLTRIEFDIIKNFPCYLCGKKNSIIHQNGIDRIDSKNKYVIGNVISCCKTCNYIKNNFNIDELVIKIYNICKKYHGNTMPLKYKKQDGTFIESVDNKTIITIAKCAINSRIKKTHDKLRHCNIVISEQLDKLPVNNQNTKQ